MTKPSFNDNRRTYKKRRLFIVEETTTIAPFLEVKWVRIDDTVRPEMAKHFAPRPITLQGDWEHSGDVYTFAYAIAPDTGPPIENPHLKMSLYDQKENRISFHPECYEHPDIHKLDLEMLQLFEHHNALVLQFMEDLKTLRKTLVFPLQFMDDLPRA